MYAFLTAFVATIIGFNAVAASHFQQETRPLQGQMAEFKGSELCRVADNTLKYMHKEQQDELLPVGSDMPTYVTLERVKQTLDFICKTYISDVRAGRQSSLHSMDFINRHFEFIRWSPNGKQIQQQIKRSTNPKQQNMLSRIPKDKILLTKYYTKLIKGSLSPSADYNQALYALPYDERGLNLQQAMLQQSSLTRYKYTRQQIMQGMLHQKKLAKPLVWVSEDSLHDIMMQGTAILKWNGKRHFLNVHRNNGIAYDYALAKDKQQRYWYFKNVPGIMGYGKDAERKIQILPHVTFAGDIQHIGLGKLLMLSYAQEQQDIHRLGILADTGGAFADNQFQLDMLTDSYYGWQDYHAANKHLPDFVEARILLKKQELQSE